MILMLLFLVFCSVQGNACVVPSATPLVRVLISYSVSFFNYRDVYYTGACIRAYKRYVANFWYRDSPSSWGMGY